AQALAAAEQAQTLEDALKIADQKAGSAPARSPTGNAVPGIGDANQNGNTPSGSDSSFNIPTPCEDLTGKYGCRDGGRIELRQARVSEGGANQTLNRPRSWRSAVAPDVQ